MLKDINFLWKQKAIPWHCSAIWWPQSEMTSNAQFKSLKMSQTPWLLTKRFLPKLAAKGSTSRNPENANLMLKNLLFGVTAVNESLLNFACLNEPVWWPSVCEVSSSFWCKPLCSHETSAPVGMPDAAGDTITQQAREAWLNLFENPLWIYWNNAGYVRNPAKDGYRSLENQTPF